MPTSDGLPKKGDRLRHVESGLVLVVVHREGSKTLYHIIAVCEDGAIFHQSHAAGYPEDHISISSMYWMLLHHIFEYV